VSLNLQVEEMITVVPATVRFGGGRGCGLGTRVTETRHMPTCIAYPCQRSCLACCLSCS
jgi:hypothetical protein